MTIIEYLDSAYTEAKYLLSQREGIHNLHGAISIVGSIVARYKEGNSSYNKMAEEDVREYMNIILTKMRIAVKTGEYPGRGSEIDNRLKRFNDRVWPNGR